MAASTMLNLLWRSRAVLAKCRSIHLKAVSSIPPQTNSPVLSKQGFTAFPRSFSTVHQVQSISQRLDSLSLTSSKCNLLQPSVTAVQPRRTRTYISYRHLKAKNVKAVTTRFYRLPFGIWIRTQPSRYKKVFRKSKARRHMILQHLFCNRQQSILLDRMTGGYYKRRRHIPDDPYEPYYHRTDMDQYWNKPQPFYP